MMDLIKGLEEKYPAEINEIIQVGNAEISLVLNDNINADQFSESLKNHFIEMIDELTILKVNIVDIHGNVIHVFSTNQ